ncbi:MAG TPA: hypothetical protein VFT50_05175 [Baekduia sp.]|nr:hypothetical protein [Baekduia sp.]
MAATYRVTIRRRGRTEKSRHASLDDALDALEDRLRALAAEQRPRTERAMGREYEPVRQVAARGELRGPRGLRAGIDVRGDGSAEAYTGHVVRRLAAARDGEDAYLTLRRVVGAAPG